MLGIIVGLTFFFKKNSDMVGTAIGVFVAALVLLVVGMFAVSKVAKQYFKETAEGLLALSEAILMLTADILLVMIMSKFASDVDWTFVLGSLALIVAIAVITGVLGVFMRQSGEDMLNALVGMSVLILSFTVSIMLLTYITKNNSQADINAAIDIIKNIVNFLFWVVVGLTLISIIINATTWLANNASASHLFSAVNIQTGTTGPGALMMEMGLILFIVSLVTLAFIIPIGKRIGDAWAGMSVIVTIILFLTACVAILAIMLKKYSVKTIAEVNSTLLVLTASFGIVAFITYEYLIPIGRDYGNAWRGILAVGFLMVGLVVSALILMSLSEIVDKEQMIQVNIMLGILTLSFATVGFITKTYLLPIGANSKEAWEGIKYVGLILAGIVGAAVLLAKNSKFIDKKGLMQANITLGTLTGSFALIAYIIRDYLIPIGSTDSAIIGKGAAMVGAALVGVFVVGAVLVKFADKLSKPEVLKGAAVLAVLSGVFYLLSLTMTQVGKAGAAMKDLTWGTMLKMVTILSGMLAVLIGLGALVGNPVVLGLLAVGSIALVGLLGLISLLSVVLMLYTTTVTNTVKFLTPTEINNFQKVIVGDKTNPSAGNFVSSIKAILEGLHDIGYLATISVGPIVTALNGVFDMVSQFVDIVIKVASMNYIDHYDENGKPVFEKIPSTAFASAADVVSKGFKEFLIYLGEGFAAFGNGYYVDEAKNKHEAKPGAALQAMDAMKDSIKPIMEAVAMFTDAVIKVSTMTIITGYDANGKPEYQQVSPDIFKTAGTNVATTFEYFIKNLGEAFATIQTTTVETIKQMKDAMGPIMDALKDFISAVLNVATARLQTGEDAQGHPQYEEITGNIITFNGSQISVGAKVKGFAAISAAGTAVSELFKLFLKNIVDGFYNGNKLKPDVDKVFKTLKENIGDIMSGLSSFIDAIIKVASAKMTTGYDANGKPIIEDISGTDVYYDEKNKKLINGTKKVTGYEAISYAGLAVGYMFTSFVDNISVGLYDIRDKIDDVMESLGENMKPLFESIDSFVTTVLKVAEAQVVDYYDDKGKPHMKSISSPGLMFIRSYKNGHRIYEIKRHGGTATGTEAIAQAGMAVSFTFLSFISEITSSLSDNRQAVSDALGVLKDSLSPVMNGIGKFVDCIVKLATMTITITDNNGKQIIKQISQGDINTAANTVVDAFLAFIRGLLNGTDQQHPGLGSPTVRAEVASVLLALGANIGKVMDALGKFIQPIIQLMTGTITTTDKDGKQVTQAIDIGKIKTLGGDLATALMQFVTTIYNTWLKNKTQFDKFDTIIPGYNSFFSAAQKWAVSLDSIIKSLGDNPDNVNKKVGIFIDAMKALMFNIKGVVWNQQFINYFSAMTSATAGWSNDLKSILEVVKAYPNIHGSIRNFCLAIDEIIGLKIPKDADRIIAGYDKIIKGTYGMIKTFDYLRNHALWLERQLIGLYSTLVKIDNYNQSQEKKREETLVKLAQNVNTLGSALENVNKQLNSLDETKLQALGLSASQGAYSAIMSTKQGEAVTLSTYQSPNSQNPAGRPSVQVNRSSVEPKNSKPQTNEISLGETAIINLLRQVIQELNLSHTKTYNLQLTQGYGLNDYKVSVF